MAIHFVIASTNDPGSFRVLSRANDPMTNPGQFLLYKAPDGAVKIDVCFQEASLGFTLAHASEGNLSPNEEAIRHGRGEGGGPEQAG